MTRLRILAVMMLTYSAMAAPRTYSYVGLPGTGIDLLPGPSSESASVLTAAVDPGSLAVLQAILPYSVIIKNSTPEPVIALTFCLYLTDPNGRTLWHNGTLHIGGGGLPTGYAALLAPSPGVSTALQPGKGLRFRKGPESTKRLASRAYLYSQQLEVQVRLEAVVFADGGVIGPDTHHSLEETNAEREATNAVIRDLLVRNIAAARDYLEAISKEPGSHHMIAEEDESDWFRSRKQQIADQLLPILDSFKSDEEFHARVRLIARSTGPLLKRREQ